MARCRVYLFTYNRNDLLPRAVNSLLNQTFTEWVCEVHNDAPDNAFPSQFIASLNDDRFVVHSHSSNLGGTVSFNMAFAGCLEDYVSILEDDNWWQPAFLERMTGVMDYNNEVSVAWSNMRLWQEKPGGQWEDTGRTTWPGNKNEFFNWPQMRQAMACLHSNGAMMLRSKDAHNYIVPGNTLFNAIELVRERTFRHPICLVAEPLANFAITLTTNRTNNKYHWIANQLMLLASYVLKAENAEFAFTNSLNYYREQQPSPIANFFLVNFLLIKNPKMYRLLSFADWLQTGKWLLRNGHKLGEMKRYLQSQDNVYRFLLEKTPGH